MDKDITISKEEQPLMVTIRCLTYNHEPYIRQCLEGFVMQKTNFRFEAIVHDDASTDGTAAIIREYAEKYPDIIKPIYETENQYSKHDGSLRRIMDAHTHGKYVAVCEGDDYWIDPLKLQKQVDFLEGNPDFIACFHNAFVYNLFAIDRSRIFNKEKKNIFGTKDLIEKKWFIPTASIVFHRVDLSDIPSCFKKYSMDVALMLYLSKSGKIYGFKEIMSVYRLGTLGSVTANNISSGKSIYTLKKYIFFLSAVNREFFNSQFEYSVVKRKMIAYLSIVKYYITKICVK